MAMYSKQNKFLNEEEDKPLCINNMSLQNFKNGLWLFRLICTHTKNSTLVNAAVALPGLWLDSTRASLGVKSVDL